MEVDFPIGATVVVRDPQLAAQLACQGECAVVIQRRRSDARVLFLSDRRAHWIADRRLWASSETSPTLGHVATALRILAPLEAQLESADARELELHVQCMQLERETLERLQRELSGELLSWRVVPYGMAQLTVILRLRA